MSREEAKEEEERLVNELAEALQEMVESSCKEMAPLWLEGTRLVRRSLHTKIEHLDFPVSESYQRLGKSSKSKYRQLACWRLAMIWKRVFPKIRDSEYERAVRAVYFTPFPSNIPPYSWSRSVAQAPALSAFESKTTLKNWAKEGAWRSVEVLREECSKKRFSSQTKFVEADLVKAGARDSLRDVLKLDDFPKNWKKI